MRIAMSAVFLAAQIITACSAAMGAPGPNMPRQETGTMTVENVDARGVTLDCQPTREGDTLVFPYTITNSSGGDIYVLDALAEMDPATGQARVNLNSAVIARGEDGFAHILRGIAPLPPDRDVSVRIIPLATRVPKGGALERRLTVELPMHEIGPYHPELPVNKYRQRDIRGVILTVHYLAASLEGLVATPVDFAPGLFRVSTPNTVGQTSSVSCELPARGLSILVRPDDFPRP
jgi:hypothetical protein